MELNNNIPKDLNTSIDGNSEKKPKKKKRNKKKMSMQ